MSLATARAFPARMALSGPAAGIVGAIEIAKEAGRSEVITLDIGGTSADVALIRDNVAELSSGRDVDGFPIRLPMIDIATVGAGGGSIAWFDTDGLFKVGPQKRRRCTRSRLLSTWRDPADGIRCQSSAWPPAVDPDRW